MTRAKNLALVSSVLLSTGCAGPMMGTLAAHCGEGICKTDVTVLDCSNGYISVADDTIEVPDSQGSEKKKIEWTIVTEGYTFPETGGIVTTSSDFLDPRLTSNRTKLTLRDEAPLGPHKYTITVVRTSSGTACKPRDPFILNR